MSAPGTTRTEGLTMTRTVSTEIAGRFHDLADTLTHNATVLSTAGLPEIVTSVRATVYGDVAAQLRLLADVEFDQAEGNPLVVAAAAGEIAAAVARRFGLLAGHLAANARVLTARTVDAVLLRRAAVYRDVASQVRMLADEAAQAAKARPRQTTRPPLSNTGHHASRRADHGRRRGLKPGPPVPRLIVHGRQGH